MSDKPEPTKPPAVSNADGAQLDPDPDKPSPWRDSPNLPSTLTEKDW